MDMNYLDTREDNTVLLIFFRSARKIGRIFGLPCIFSLSVANIFAEFCPQALQGTYYFGHESILNLLLNLFLKIEV